MTVAWSNDLVAQAAAAEDCGHLLLKRYRDGDGRERCLECDRLRNRDYDQRRADRNRRHDRSRERGPKTVDVRELKRRVRLTVVDAEPLPQRPRTRAECIDGPRPCPWVGCRYNLHLDVTPAGSLRLNFPGVEPEEMPPTGSCALDLADAGPRDDYAVGERLNVVRERVRQIVVEALGKLAAAHGNLRELLER